MNRLPTVEALALIKYPTTKSLAALEWGCNLEVAYSRLHRGLRMGLLDKTQGRYIPTTKALEGWINLGLL